MRTTIVLMGTLCLLLPLSGCGQSPFEGVLGETEAALGETSKTLNQLTGKLDEALKGTGQIDREKLKGAIEEAENLKLAGEKMMAAKVQLDTLNVKLSDSQRAALIKQFEDSLKTKFAAVNSAYENLTDTMTKVELRATKDAFEALQKAYRTGKEKFEIIAKAR